MYLLNRFDLHQCCLIFQERARNVLSLLNKALDGFPSPYCSIERLLVLFLIAQQILVHERIRYLTRYSFEKHGQLRYSHNGCFVILGSSVFQLEICYGIQIHVLQFQLPSHRKVGQFHEPLYLIVDELLLIL